MITGCVVAFVLYCLKKTPLYEGGFFGREGIIVIIYTPGLYHTPTATWTLYPHKAASENTPNSLGVRPHFEPFYSA
jgi:hypothetical protein